jgi:hypothetical protein
MRKIYLIPAINANHTSVSYYYRYYGVKATGDIHADRAEQFFYTMKPEQQKKKPEFSLTRNDGLLGELVKETDHTTLAVWAVDCAGRVLPFFENKYPDDPRPRDAILACRAWITTGIFRMADIRRASLASHAAAREVGEDNASRSAARAAGQAVATAHVKLHATGAANYAVQAVFRAANASDADAATARERDWQYQHLLALKEKSASDY